MRKGLARRRGRQGGRPEAARRRLPFVALEGLEGRSLFSATFVPAGDLASPAPAEEQTFGAAIATRGNLALVGTGMGSAALYDTSTNTLIGTYFDSEDPDGWLGHRFGYSVAFFGSGNSFAIGAPGDNGGKVYIYTSPGSSPTVLTATQIDNYDPEEWTYAPGFGTALAGYGDHLLVNTAADMAVGGNGTVHEINLAGQVVRDFHSPELGLVAFDQFGTHMAVSGDQILFYSQPTNFGPSTLYLFDGTDFYNQGQLRRFADPTGNGWFRFGASMAFDGDTIVVGAPGHDVQVNGDGTRTTVGAGYVYQYSASSGQETFRYAQPATIPTVRSFTFSSWGAGLAIAGGRLVIGAPMALNESISDFAGQIYAYDLNTHEQLAYAVAPDEGGMFGMSIAPLSGGRFLVADPYSQVFGFDAGQVHVYGLVVDSPNPETSPPVARAGDDRSAVVEQEVSFSGSGSTAAAGVSITKYEWDFDYDGTNFNPTATGVDAAHAYAAAGTYTVALKVTDEHGKTSIATVVVTVALPPAPTADAGPDRSAVNGQAVSLAAGGTGTGLSYAWDFNYDGVTFRANAVGATTSVSYAASGSHTVALRVTDAYGRSVIDTLVVVTKAPPPTADAGPDRSAVAGTGVPFRGTAAAGLGATVASVYWDFNYDGVTFHPVAAGADANYVYLTPGVHIVAFRVVDSDGNVATDTAAVTVVAAPPTASAGANQSAVAGNAVALHGTAVAGTGSTIASVEWDFNYDGVTFRPSASGADASATYTTAGAHTVAFRVTDSDGQSAIATAVVTVVARPPMAEAGADQSVQTGQTVTLHGTAAAGLGSTVASVAWDFNYDGITFRAGATTADATTTYATAGTYTVAFRVTGADGQISIDTAVVTVATPPPPPVVVVSGVVQVTGTASANTITLDEDRNKNIVITLNGTTYGPFTRGSTVVIHGGPGNDLINAGRKVQANLVVFGGAGNDTIIGGGGSDILIGGDGDDLIIAGSGRDIIIGGAGADNLQGKTGEDILIAGWTVFDTNPTALNAILAEWMSGRQFDKRIANLLNGNGSADRANGSYFLKPGVTVFDDGVVDTLSGGGGKDWMIFNATGSGVLDILTDKTGADVITDL